MRRPIISFAACLILVGLLSSTILAENPEIAPMPVIYSGSATIQGSPIEAGLSVVVCVD